MIFRSDVPVKFRLGLHNEPTLIEDKSYLFDIICHLSRSSSKGLDSMKFSAKTLKYVFGQKLEDETFKASIVKAIKKFIESGDISVSGDSMQVTQKGLSNFYSLE